MPKRKNSLLLFSMFIPDTYEFYWTASPEEFVRRMRREYDRFWTPERDRLRRRSGLSRAEVMTLASIVYEETRQSDEMPRVAGVYINRLRRGMPLQADPTIKYAMQDFGLRRIQFPFRYSLAADIHFLGQILLRHISFQMS